MQVCLVATYDLNIYPGLYYLARALDRRGCRCTIMSHARPMLDPTTDRRIRYVPIQGRSGLLARVPLLRGDYHGILWKLLRIRPDAVIAQHGTMVSALAYKMLQKSFDPVVVGYCGDYITGAWWLPVLQRGMGHMDAYIDVGELRMQWRREDWPGLPEHAFVVKNAPPLAPRSQIEPHSGPGRLMFTGRNHGDAMRVDLLVRFLRELCGQGTRVTWLMPGEESDRAAIRQAVDRERFTIQAGVPKEALMDRMAGQDVGLLWNPLEDSGSGQGPIPNYVSAAPNKLGEYLAAGLAVLYTENPALEPLGEYGCGRGLDPFRPEAEARRLGKLLSNRQALEGMRRKALHLHRQELNAEAQAAEFVEWFCEELKAR